MTRTLIVEADGGSRGNPGPAAFGAVVRDGATGELLVEVAEFIGDATNNVAEYRGAIAGITEALAVDATATISVNLDSKLVVEQMSGRWKIKNAQLQQLALAAKALVPADRVTYTWIPRERNAAADALVNSVLDAALAGGRTTLRREAGVSDVSDVLGIVEEQAARARTREAVLAKPGVMVGWADTAPATTTLLARHGATEDSLRKVFSGSGGANPELAPVGIEQARALAQEMRHRDPIDVIIASPMRRTIQTAEIVADLLGLSIDIDEGFIECDFGEWDGHTFAEVQTTWPRELDAWLASTDVAPPGGESFAQVRARVDEARHRLLEAHAAKRVLVVSHVSPIKMMVSAAIDAPPHSVYRMELRPCSISTVSWFADGHASLFGFAEAHHVRDIEMPSGT